MKTWTDNDVLFTILILKELSSVWDSPLVVMMAGY